MAGFCKFRPQRPPYFLAMMILKSLSRLIERVLLWCVAAFSVCQLHASFQYNVRDLLLGFRQATGPSDLVVNLGSVTNLYAIPPGTTIAITNLSTNQLNAAFANLNGVSW